MKGRSSSKTWCASPIAILLRICCTKAVTWRRWCSRVQCAGIWKIASWSTRTRQSCSVRLRVVGIILEPAFLFAVVRRFGIEGDKLCPAKRIEELRGHSGQQLISTEKSTLAPPKRKEQPKGCSFLTPNQAYFALAGGTIPFIRRYSANCP